MAAWRAASSNDFGWPIWKEGALVHLLELADDRLLDLFAAVAGIDAPQACRAVDHLASFRRPVVHALGAGQQPGVLLELPVRGERHEEGFEVVGGGRGGGRGHGGTLKRW